jgi:hypothetical protein
MGSYRERLLVPVSYWLLAVPSIAFLGAEVHRRRHRPAADARDPLRDRGDLPHQLG